MKKILSVIITVAMMLSMTTVFADFDALYTTSKVVVDGKEVAFEAYNIDDNNYFKLRDVAKAISGSEKQFEVTWNQEANAIELVSGTGYTEVGGEHAKGDGTAKKAVLTTSQIKLDGEWIAEGKLKAYNINDNNYFKLRDLGKLFDFGISWDGVANCITINTQEAYVVEETEEEKQIRETVETYYADLMRLVINSTVDEEISAMGLPEYAQEPMKEIYGTLIDKMMDTMEIEVEVVGINGDSASANVIMSVADLDAINGMVIGELLTKEEIAEFETKVASVTTEEEQIAVVMDIAKMIV